ncbi:MAG: methylmalonyl-CoA mutase family protein [Gemmatimonadetes bacterium]|nr:methylmalonyl-CoA mutase family protein [Gemmatimonadota bacterium]
MNEREKPRPVYTDSGIEVDPVYTTARVEDSPLPGTFPFTRGIHPDMYRERLWTMRQYAGFGTPQETNKRFHYLLDRGQTGLSVAFDLPTQMGHDSDANIAVGEVGRVGVAIDSVEDMKALFEGIPLGEVSTSMTINSTAAILLALYIAVADEQGVDRNLLGGTLQNDILKEYIARGTYIYPVEESLRLTTDIISFCREELPNWNPISISGYHIREAGATAPQELAFTLANGLEYIARAVEAGLDINAFAPRLSFFFAAHNDLFEEVAKFRAARRLWATLLRQNYEASDNSCRLRFHTQTGGSTLSAQQALNNIIRVTIQALSATLGGSQSLHTNGYDEALALPTKEAAKLALRTQQIIASESGITRTVDPLGGSYYVEALTDQIESAAVNYLDTIEELGGASKAIEYMVEEIQTAAYKVQLDVESGQREIVGVNVHAEEDEALSIEKPAYEVLEQEQIARLKTHKERRIDGTIREQLEGVRSTARGNANLMPRLISSVKAGVTLGELSDVLRSEWGAYHG